jgi:hypothetical protein
MGDLPPDLERLRTLETWLVLSLDRVREQIAAVERSEQPQRAARPPAAARPAVPRRAPTPDWGISAAGIGAPSLRSTGATASPGAGRCGWSVRSVPVRSWPRVSRLAGCAAPTTCSAEPDPCPGRSERNAPHVSTPADRAQGS